MRIDWEEVLGTRNQDEVADVYDEKASDALYQDHPRAAPPGEQVDPGDEPVELPFEEE